LLISEPAGIASEVKARDRLGIKGECQATDDRGEIGATEPCPITISGPAGSKQVPCVVALLPYASDHSEEIFPMLAQRLIPLAKAAFIAGLSDRQMNRVVDEHLMPDRCVREVLLRHGKPARRGRQAPGA
jgi:hypothetical protein